MYCKIKEISEENFGEVLDSSPQLSEQLVDEVSNALSEGRDIEKTLYDFCNTHAQQFKLKLLLDEKDLDFVQKKFSRIYHTVTATNENPHMDDFMILDLETSNKEALFVTHQGSICVNFSEIISPVIESDDKQFFNSIRKDFETHPVEIPNSNDFIVTSAEIEANTLLTQLTYSQLDQLPTRFKELCTASPNFKFSQFLHYVGRGNVEEALILLESSQNKQEFLLKSGALDDDSGRFFNCTAFEYAYWAGHIDMFLMLFQNMDKTTKAALLKPIEEINKKGLIFRQDNQEKCSINFDFSTLINVMREYLETGGSLLGSHLRQKADSDWNDDWLKIGMAQRDVPRYVARKIYKVSDGKTTSSMLTFFNRVTQNDESWYPLVPNSGLGYNFSIFNSILGPRSSNVPIRCGEPDWYQLNKSLGMIISLEQEISSYRNALLKALIESAGVPQDGNHDEPPNLINSSSESGFRLDDDLFDSESGFRLDDDLSDSESGFGLN